MRLLVLQLDDRFAFQTFHRSTDYRGSGEFQETSDVVQIRSSARGSLHQRFHNPLHLQRKRRRGIRIPAQNPEAQKRNHAAETCGFQNDNLFSFHRNGHSARQRRADNHDRIVSRLYSGAVSEHADIQNKTLCRMRSRGGFSCRFRCTDRRNYFRGRNDSGKLRNRHSDSYRCFGCNGKFFRFLLHAGSYRSSCGSTRFQRGNQLWHGNLSFHYIRSHQRASWSRTHQTDLLQFQYF